MPPRKTCGDCGYRGATAKCRLMEGVQMDERAPACEFHLPARNTDNLKLVALTPIQLTVLDAFVDESKLLTKQQGQQVHKTYRVFATINTAVVGSYLTGKQRDLLDKVFRMAGALDLAGHEHAELRRILRKIPKGGSK